MQPQLKYPSSNHPPDPLVDLSDKEVRVRLSGSALRAFFNIIGKWKLRDQEGRALLGGIASSTYYDYKKNPDKLLDQDKLTRVSYLIGLYKALHIQHGDDLADRWVGMANSNRIFAGQTPLEAMIKGGAPMMQRVRRLLDARRGGR